MTQQRVDKGVARCLAVGQTFGEHTPAWTDGLWPEELHNSASNQAQRKERRGRKRREKVTSHLENKQILRLA